MAQSGTKPQLKCSQCGKTFNSQSELREHQKNCKGGVSR
jgi:DNA-directed RNA polymerase subunit RPC12/RpoP